jgi:hypothetical protein
MGFVSTCSLRGTRLAWVGWEGLETCVQLIVHARARLVLLVRAEARGLGTLSLRILLPAQLNVGIR